MRLKQNSRRKNPAVDFVKTVSNGCCRSVVLTVSLFWDPTPAFWQQSLSTIVWIALSSL